MDLAVTKTEYGADDRSWLGSAHGTDMPRSITLDGALMIAEFADGDVPSGVVLGKVTATGEYGPYDDAAGDGRQVARGFLYSATKVVTGRNIGAALYEHGRVVEAKLPANSGIDAAAKVDLADHVIFA